MTPGTLIEANDLDSEIYKLGILKRHIEEKKIGIVMEVVRGMNMPNLDAIVNDTLEKLSVKIDELIKEKTDRFNEL